jgi:deoxyadenosine/deoxycytidine kinase
MLCNNSPLFMESAKRPYIISIEGNIGSGKTTFLQRLEERQGELSDSKNFIFLREPVDVWKNIRDGTTSENIIEKLYSDPIHYACPFQIMAYITFYRRLVNAINNGNEDTIIICERSMESCRAIFAKMLREQGNIDDINSSVLEMVYDEIELIPVDAVAYLNVSARTCDTRIKGRARKGEHDIPMDYLEKCQKYHEKWLLSLSLWERNPPIPTMWLHEDSSEDAMVAHFKQFIEDNCRKFVGCCDRCNVETKIYSNERYFLLTKDADKKLLCENCFTACWKEARNTGWYWEENVVYTWEECEGDTESV